MLVPGLVFSAGRVLVTKGAGTVPDFFNQGFGFMNDGSLAIDTDTAAGSFYTSGFRQSAAGALYGTQTEPGASTFNCGLALRNASGRALKFSLASSIVGYANGNPVTAAGALCAVEGTPALDDSILTETSDSLITEGSDFLITET